ncbi:MAG: hypothetical protein H6600_01415 [Flavobacteriales bacterium]|nr:hypothetical protein [Flavobacteriales bacterium]
MEIFFLILFLASVVYVILGLATLITIWNPDNKIDRLLGQGQAYAFLITAIINYQLHNFLIGWMFTVLHGLLSIYLIARDHRRSQEASIVDATAEPNNFTNN